MPHSDPDVRVRVLGPLRVDVDGVPADPGGRRPRELLARLAVANGETVSTDTLIDDLWHGEPPPRALGALQVHVSRLRRVLEPRRSPRTPASVLVSSASGYALALAPDDLDSRRFVRLVAGAADVAPSEAERLLDDALGAWSGRAFADVADTGWAGPEAARLEELRLVATERLARARLDLGRPDAAVPDLERLVRDHPLREGAVARLALALYRSGRQADALDLLARTRRLLADELGVDPGPELRDLERDVLAHTVPPHVTASPVAHDGLPAQRSGRPDAHAGPPSGTSSGVGPGTEQGGGTDRAPQRGRGTAPGRDGGDLVGRGAELARLGRVADGVPAGPGAQVVLVSADAGAGKSALATAFAIACGDRGWTVATGRCPEVDGAPPGWVWREVVDGLRPGHPDGTGALSAAAPGERAFWLARTLVGLLAEEGARCPVLVVLDDLHRADGETLQVLRTVVAGLRDAPVLVLATLRPTEVSTDLQAALAALAGPIADRVEPSPLDRADVARVLERHGVVHPSPATAALVAERTGGNPLFVRELARLIAAEGVAAATDAVPAGVRDVLRRRVARLPGPARTALSRIAVLGRDADVDVALELTGDPEVGLDALELGVLSGLLVEPAPGRVRFSHALVCDTLYDDLPRLRRTRLHAAALDALARHRPDDPVPLGHHALAAGGAVDPGRACELAERAARSAAGYGAHREAARFLDAALALAGPAGIDPDRETTLRCRLVSALAHAGDGVAAVRARRAALAGCGPERLVDVLTSYDAPVSWTIRPDQRVDAELVGLLETELARTSDVERRTRLLCALVFELENHDDDRVRSAGAEAVALTHGHPDPLLRCAALNARFFAVLGPDLWPELEGVGTELLDRADRAGHAGYRSQGHHLLFMVCVARHDLDAAQRHVDAAIATAPTGQLGLTLGWAETYGALRALLRGDLDEAESAYVAVGERLVAAGSVNGGLLALVGRFAVRHAQGRHGELADELEALAGRMPPSFSDFVAASLLAAGRTERARAVWRPDVELSRSYYWLLWTCLRAEVAVGLGDRVVGARCRAQLLAWAGTFAGLSSGTVTLGPVDLVLADLAELLDRPDAGAHRRAAARLCSELGATPWTDRVPAC